MQWFVLAPRLLLYRVDGPRFHLFIMRPTYSPMIPRNVHGFADFGECGEVHNGVDGRFGKELVEEGAVGDIADHQAGGGRYRRAVAAGEVIENGDLKIALQEEANGGPANVASAASDEDVLGHVVRTNYAPVQTKALPLVLFF